MAANGHLCLPCPPSATVCAPGGTVFACAHGSTPIGNACVATDTALSAAAVALARRAAAATAAAAGRYECGDRTSPGRGMSAAALAAALRESSADPLGGGWEGKENDEEAGDSEERRVEAGAAPSPSFANAWREALVLLDSPAFPSVVVVPTGGAADGAGPVVVSTIATGGGWGCLARRTIRRAVVPAAVVSVAGGVWAGAAAAAAVVAARRGGGGAGAAST
ncbi:hypothetical protein MMPV_007085 [Pyropia vietnamensis]